MNLQVVYCNHQTAGLDVREKLAFSSKEQLEEAYSILKKSYPETEMVVISTCNRVELYTATQEPESGPSHQELAKFFSEFHHVPVSDFFEDFLERTGPDAVRHLFQVASSLDSMVLGEPQIVNQVKEAYQRATENALCGPLTHALFQQAIRVSARVRTETMLAEGRVSIASVAVGTFGKSIFERFDDKTVLIIGAGEMAEETLTYLKDEGVKKIVVVNRSLENAQKLAVKVGGEARPFDDLDDCLAEADVIVSTTGASQPIVDVERFQRVLKKSGNKTFFILDLGAPRDFTPAVGQINDNIFLFDIDNLEATCEKNRRARQKEVEKALTIIDEETERFMHGVYHRATGPIIKQLREQWHDVREQEVDKLFSKLSHLDEKDQELIKRSIEQIVNKLLHPPLEVLRQEAREGTPHGLLDALKHLFHIRD
ncbi:MAG: glutamyl-tRNA reductase [Gimesia sp.]|uniref:Glutamyl-tRNA reductase n=1 Tax=Gimesia chilikensis TaxID=2605989 RepID=A0A517PLW9_9PLAN|nr:glutamyl-tRNA reductase [Gimesia chilikensis]MBN69243.1 glutamyl-tRNA reductase [Gimesia sp.]MCR9231294.1 glutamyl-tRNA reductase [bacterium]QDT20369.1 Glutamyl-tRNA reductase [Gimesia chilikensis]